ncbi:hypothetical protein IQ235_16390 [Oscillatoriales cyanobacterium LEGE 11467]|uniref:Uncharacterized protein n=1 Tax=Zarconia navalis LEGE 11467 TaxID=1828826 RepID=A0A928ZA50_9CYAN|nr:hypothetical protein [Zarconia navalis]MBE9042353.1 hypothetical protein [Zarconia navalis LEGE 11467]
MNQLNRILFQILGIGLLSFLVAGVVLGFGFATPTKTILVDRSYCPEYRWESVVETYTQLYRQYQYKRLQLDRVILLNDWGEEIFKNPPTPKELQNLRTYGRSNLPRQMQLQQADPNLQVLNCQAIN